MSDRFTIRKVERPVVVRAGGAILGETDNALLLEEEGHPPVYYIPRGDILLEFLGASETSTTCPHKGEATHYHIVSSSGPIKDACWSYENPKDGAEQIRDHLAFYADKAVVEEL